MAITSNDGSNHVFEHYARLSDEDLKGLLRANVLSESDAQVALAEAQRRGLEVASEKRRSGAAVEFVVTLLAFVFLMSAIDGGRLLTYLFTFLSLFIPCFIVAVVTSRVIPKYRALPYSDLVVRTTRVVAISGVFMAFGLWYGQQNTRAAISLVPQATASEDRVAPITALITIQDAEGMTEADLDTTSLKRLEQWMVQRTLERARQNYASQGFEPTMFQPQIDVGSVYALAGGKKLAVIRMTMNNRIRSMWVMGFNKGDFLRVTCVRGSNHDIPLFSGECGQKVTEAFGVSIRPQLVQ